MPRHYGLVSMATLRSMTYSLHFTHKKSKSIGHVGYYMIELRFKYRSVSCQILCFSYYAILTLSSTFFCEIINTTLSLFPWGPQSLLREPDKETIISLGETQCYLPRETLAFLGDTSRARSAGRSLLSSVELQLLLPNLHWTDVEVRTYSLQYLEDALASHSNLDHGAPKTVFLMRNAVPRRLDDNGDLSGQAQNGTICDVLSHSVSCLTFTPHSEWGTLRFRFSLQTWWNWDSETAQGGKAPLRSSASCVYVLRSVIC